MLAQVNWSDSHCPSLQFTISGLELKDRPLGVTDKFGGVSFSSPQLNC